MASPWEEVKKETGEVPMIGYSRSVSPLPWLLLTLSMALTVVVLLVGRNRLAEEKERTWSALKANDELNQRLKSTQKELEREKGVSSQGDESQDEANRRIIELELQNRILQDELSKLKKGSPLR
jgi:hypothetical protein